MNSKLILLDVFSYSCMNCLRSLRFIKKINNKYKKYGLETIIIHPPEWEFEKSSKNILNALKQYKITFPIIIDKNKKILKKLKINFWPTQVLIKDKKILYKHIGEGGYKELEKNIVKFLKVQSKRLFNEEPKYSKYPTVYCGKKKKGNVKILKNKLDFGTVYIDNKSNWIRENEFLKSTKNSSLTTITKGNIINFVAESLDIKNKIVKVVLNNKIIRNITIKNPQLYNIIKIKNNKHYKLTIITKPNLAIYSFSFQ